jgi:plastocyanin
LIVKFMKHLRPITRLPQAISWWLLGAFMFGCQKSEESNEMPANAVEVPKGTSLTGMIRYEGAPLVLPELPKPSPGDVGCHHEKGVKDDRFIVSADGGLGGVVVEIMDTVPALDPDPGIIDQAGCRFAPHVVAIQLGASLSITNLDPTFHNVRVIRHKTGTYKEGENLSNFGQMPGATPLSVPLKEAGLYRLECDVHRWMSCFVIVSGGSHVAVSDASGNFAIGRVLADGTYKVRIWHPLLREFRFSDVTISGGKAQLNMTLKPEDFLPAKIDPTN